MICYERPINEVILQTVNSLLTIETDQSHRIVRHTEEWDHKHEPTSEDGFWGSIQEFRKKLTADTTALFVGQKPPNEK